MVKYYRQTDKILIARPLLHSMQPSKNLKTFFIKKRRFFPVRYFKVLIIWAFLRLFGSKILCLALNGEKQLTTAIKSGNVEGLFTFFILYEFLIYAKKRQTLGDLVCALEFVLLLSTRHHIQKNATLMKTRALSSMRACTTNEGKMWNAECNG